MKDLIKKVEKVVVKAAEIMKKAFGIEVKGDAANIVTDADVAIQNFLIGELKALLPGSGFFGEENHVYEKDNAYVWVVDPIDGTTNFSRDICYCAISVALVHGNRPMLGVVYVPGMNEMFTAVAGQGAYLNGKQIKVLEQPYRSALLCTAMSLYKKELAPVCSDIINEVYRETGDYRRFGSCAIELCYLAAGRCDLYFEIRVFPWDYAAAYLILTEAGGVLKGLGDTELGIDVPTVLVGANNRDNYRRLSAVVNKYLPKTPYEPILP